jgi:hypothetical protein
MPIMKRKLSASTTTVGLAALELLRSAIERCRSAGTSRAARTARAATRSSPSTAGAIATARELEALFEVHGFNAFPMGENGRMVGLVTKFYFLKAFAFTSRRMVPHYDELMSVGYSRKS